jgi:hypothetical protein
LTNGYPNKNKKKKKKKNKNNNNNNNNKVKSKPLELRSRVKSLIFPKISLLLFSYVLKYQCNPDRFETRNPDL